jgi:hypothetical protein
LALASEDGSEEHVATLATRSFEAGVRAMVGAMARHEFP